MSEATTAPPTSTEPGTVDANAYRAFVTVPRQDRVAERVAEQLQVWLGEKGWDAPLASSGFTQRGPHELLVLHHHGRASRELRVRLREATRTGQWQTDLTLSTARDGTGWIAITVTNSEGRFVDVPRIAAYVLDVLDGCDGPATLTSQPVLVAAPGVEDLMDELCSEEREGLLLVAGTANDSPLFDLFRRRVATWTRQVRGLARVVVLDPIATTTFAREIGPAHAVPAWTLRTFLPLVDPAVELDGRRHRILGVPALAERSDHDLARLLGRAARAHAATRSPHPAALAAMRALVRLEAKTAVSGLAAASQDPDPAGDAGSPLAIEQPPSAATSATALDSASPTEVADGASAYLTELEVVQRTFGLDRLDAGVVRRIAERAQRSDQIEAAIARITRDLDERQERVEHLEDEVTFYREYAEEEEFERVLADAERTRLADQVRFLQRRLRELNDFDTANSAVPDSAYTSYPGSFEQLVARVSELEPDGVVFSADPKKSCELDEHDSLGKLARSAWDALMVLRDYLSARRGGQCETGIEGYLKHTPTGFRNFPMKKFAATETARTMTAYGAERIFPIPTSVAASGHTTMKAHFKLGRCGRVSPRMYVLDRFPVDGRVYVGYLGEHPTNTQTN